MEPTPLTRSRVSAGAAHLKRWALTRGQTMALRRFLSRILSIGTVRALKFSDDITPPLVEWPLPEALPIAPLKPADQFVEGRKTQHSDRGGIHVFAYPFETPEIGKIVPGSWSSPEAGDATDGKYCEVASEDGTTRYIACRALVDALQHDGPQPSSKSSGGHRERASTRHRGCSVDRLPGTHVFCVRVGV